MRKLACHACALICMWKINERRIGAALIIAIALGGVGYFVFAPSTQMLELYAMIVAGAVALYFVF
jgi:hypothetical protein